MKFVLFFFFQSGFFQSPYRFKYQHLTPFYGWGVFYYMNRPQFVHPLTCCWTFGLFLVWNTHAQTFSWAYAFTSPGSIASSEKAGSEQISVFSSNALLLECLEIEPFFLCGQGSDFKQKFFTREIFQSSQDDLNNTFDKNNEFEKSVWLLQVLFKKRESRLPEISVSFK